MVFRPDDLELPHLLKICQERLRFLELVHNNQYVIAHSVLHSIASHSFCVLDSLTQRDQQSVDVRPLVHTFDRGRKCATLLVAHTYDQPCPEMLDRVLDAPEHFIINTVTGNPN